MFSKLCVLFISLTVTLCACHKSSLQEESGTLYGSITGLNDLIITSDVAFSSEPVTSRFECLFMCMHDCTCVTFTHTVTSSGQECRGHSYSINYEIGWVPGSKTFIVHPLETPWLNTACTTGDENPVADSLCAESGRFLCSPGFYYSVSTYACVKDCQTCALQQEVMTHSGYGILGHVDSAETGLNATACSAGLIDSVYLTATYNATAGTCHSHGLTYIDVPTSERISENPEMTYFQRKCV